MPLPISSAPSRIWWQRSIPYSPAEILADGIVHGIGILIATFAGTALLASAALGTAIAELPALIVYVTSLLLLFGVSMAFNLSSHTPTKRFLARLDQAAIFLLIAGTYTPVLALLADTAAGQWMTIAVWSAALVGVALKLIVPEHFGRLAIVFYLGIGFSGFTIFHTLAERLPPDTLLLLVAGGLTYSAGIVFHLWERLRFQNALWHCFVVAGATLHLLAMLDCMVFSRV